MLPCLVGLLLTIPTPLVAQRDSTVGLEEGDRVRVWSAGSDLRGRELEFLRWREGSLVLSELPEGEVTRLHRRRVDRLQVRRESGGTNLWEGVAIGSAAGLVADFVYVAAGGCAFSYGWCVLFVSPRTILPGAVLGGLVGTGFPEYEWVAVDVGPAAGAGAGSGRTGLSVRVRLRLPDFP